MKTQEEELRRLGATEKAVGLRWRGIRVIINDQEWAKERKQSVSSTKLVSFGLKQTSAVQRMKWESSIRPLTDVF